MSTRSPDATVRVPPSSARRLRRVGVVVVPLMVAVLIALTGCTPNENATGTRTGNRKLTETDTGFVTGKALTRIPPEEREKAPVVSGPPVSGRRPISTADYPGKVLVLNVWGSWCAPCRAEATDLAEASNETRDVAAFVGLNVRDNSIDAARAFSRAFKVTYPSIYDPAGEQLVRFAGTLPPNGIPTTLVIDRDGRIAARVVGIVDKTTLLGLIKDTAQGR